jgi:hypothetical protein
MGTQAFVRFSHMREAMKVVPILGALSFALLIALALPSVSSGQTSGNSVPVAQCTPTFSDCAIPEETHLQFPFLAISGDAALAPTLNSDLAAVSDVFRIDNNFFDSGLGTGIGFSCFLFSGHYGTLPGPVSYSANAVEMRENPEGLGDTQYFGNGTDYHLATGVVSSRGGSKASLPAKNVALDLADGAVSVANSYGLGIGQGPDQDPGQADGLAFYSTNYASLGGKQIPFNIVGTNPANGAATTTVPTVIVPIKVVYQLAHGPIALDGSNVVTAVEDSPIFQVADYNVRGTDLGVTQYGDALQRAEFYNLPGFSPNYHVLLGAPTVMAPLVVTVTSATQGNLYRLRNGGLIGVVKSSVLDAQINSQIHGFTADTLPIFITDNVFEGFDGTINTCCVLGYHNSQRPPASSAKTWIYAAHTESGTFVNNVIDDVQALSHEVAEWLNDPFVGALAIGYVNLVPPAVLPGTGGRCIINFETGDPLEAPPVAFTQTTNGTTYHLQDEVLLPWYLHSKPSFSVNGQFTFQNTFTTPSSLCGPG